MEMKDRDKVLENVTDLLTDAVLKFNLLRVKVNSPVVMNFQSTLEGCDSNIGIHLIIFFLFSMYIKILSNRCGNIHHV